MDIFQLRKIQIKDKISCVKSKINLLLNGWRSPNCNKYIIIYAYFISKEYRLKYCLLGFQKVNKVKSGQLIAEITANIINNYEINQNFRAFIINNAMDNNIIFKELATQFNINISYSRLWYFSYIINLIIKALLFNKGVSKLKQKLASALYDKVFKN